MVFLLFKLTVCKIIIYNFEIKLDLLNKNKLKNIINSNIIC
jgi:hypothetical protein